MGGGSACAAGRAALEVEREGGLPTDDATKAARAMLRARTPAKAKEILESLELPERERNCILWHDIQDIPMDIVADRLCLSPRQAKRIHRDALRHAAQIILQ
jgi:hypothetical protein